MQEICARVRHRGFRNAIAWGMLCVALFAPSAHAQGEPTEFNTHHDTIPNFCAPSTIVTIADGDWDEIATWSTGVVPGPSDRVSVIHDVSYASTSGDINCLWIHDEGSVTFATNTDTKLQASNILVTAGGTLTIGTEATPIDADKKAEIVIKDTPLNTGTVENGTYIAPAGVPDPFQWGTALIVIDGTLHLHGAPKQSTFVRTATEPKQGENTIQIEQTVTGWRAGDRLVLPDTRHLAWNEKRDNYVPQWEVLTLNSAPTGTELTIDAPLQFDHNGARDKDGVLDFLPHVANLTRNIVIRSESLQEAGKSSYCEDEQQQNDTANCATRGHTAFLQRADIRASDTEFFNLGRTTTAVDSTEKDPNTGAITKIGTNQIARYPVHTHHLYGPTGLPADIPQFTLLRNSVWQEGGDTVTQSSDFYDGVPEYRWAYAIHGSHYGLIQENVGFFYAGAIFVAEDGTETANEFLKNIAIASFGWGSFGSVESDEGQGFWFRGVLNNAKDNTAANFWGDRPNIAYGYKIIQRGLGNIAIPSFKGANPTMPGESTTIDSYAATLGEFSGNEVYSAPSGLTIWWVGTFGDNPRPITEDNLIKDMKMWHIDNLGIYLYPTHRIVIDNLVARGNPALTFTQFDGSAGILGGDYMQSDLTITNSDIQGVKRGIHVSTHSKGKTTIKDTYLRTYFGIEIESPGSVNGSDRIEPQLVHIDNVQFDLDGITPLPFGHEPPFSLRRTFGNVSFHNNFVQKDEVFVYDYNGNAAQDYQVYYHEQHPTFIVPQSGDGGHNPTASPEAGLTNLENWAKYNPDGTLKSPPDANTPGLAIAGEIAPCSDVFPNCPEAENIPEIDGFAFAINVPEVCLIGQLENRTMDGETRMNLPNVDVTITDTATSTVVKDVTVPINISGKIAVIDLTGLDDNATYDIAVRPHGLLRKTVSNRTNIISGGCIDLGGFQLIDTNGNGVIELSDLVGFVNFYKTLVHSALQDLFQYKNPGVNHLVRAVVNFISQQ